MIDKSQIMSIQGPYVFHTQNLMVITYCLQGLDQAPRTPPRGPRHRKTPSRSNLASKEKSSSEDKPAITNGVKGADAKVKKEVVFENLQGEKNGSKLMSVKSDDYEKQVRENKKQAPKPAKEEKLATGREAGRRWGTSAIRFAPLNVPLQRRLQTLVVLWHTLCIALLTSIFCFLCAIPLFWPLLIPYMVYCMSSKASTNGTLSHRSEFLRSLPIWSLFSSYFPARLHRSQELPPTRKYIFGYHPHGIISMGAFAAFGTESLGFGQLFPGIKNTLLTLDSNFRIPIYRDYALAMGLGSVSKESCENLLSKGGPNNVG
jgi:2-acylglycerol O-acyltransferase 2